MLKTVGVESMEQLLSETIPDNIRLDTPLKLDSAMSEQDFAAHINTLANQNEVFRSYIGLG
jgi:glycine dehydrogenase